SDHVQDYIHPFSSGKGLDLTLKFLFPIVDGQICPQLLTSLAFCRGAGGDDDISPHGFYHLDSSHSYTATAPMYQYSFSRPKLSDIKNIIPYGKECFR